MTETTTTYSRIERAANHVASMRPGWPHVRVAAFIMRCNASAMVRDALGFRTLALAAGYYHERGQDCEDAHYLWAACGDIPAYTREDLALARETSKILKG